jgi:hypothetical protein
MCRPFGAQYDGTIGAGVGTPACNIVSLSWTYGAGWVYLLGNRTFRYL